MVEAEQRLYGSGLQVLYELALAPQAVSAGIVRFIAETPLQLRLACEVPRGGGPARRAWAAAEAAAALVLDGIPDRLTFQAVLGPGTRLREVRQWARERQLLHLDVLVLGTHPGGAAAVAVEEYRGDLLAAAEEFARDLAQERPPLDLQPLTGIVRRLLRAGVAGEEVYRPHGEDAASGALRAFLPLATGAGAIVSARAGRPVGEVPVRCEDCWAQRACGASTLLTAAPPDEHGWGPSPRRCALRRAEAEAAVLLTARLAGPRARFALRVLEEMGKAPLDPFSHAGWAGETPAIA